MTTLEGVFFLRVFIIGGVCGCPELALSANFLVSQFNLTVFCPLWLLNAHFPPTVGKLMELHGEGSSSSAAKGSGDDTGAKVERADGYEPPIQETV